MERLVALQHHLISSSPVSALDTTTTTTTTTTISPEPTRMEDTEINAQHTAGSSSSSSSSSFSSTPSDNDVCIVSAVRTPTGSFGGKLSGFTACQLGSIAITAALERAKITGDLVDEVFMGNVLSANLGQAPASQAAFSASIPTSVPCTTINKVCASGMKAIMFGSQAIQLGTASVVVAGGMESMSNAPYYLPKARNGYKHGHGQVVDGMVHDGLWDPYNDCHMGSAGEVCSTDYNIPRSLQDEYSKRSVIKARASWESGFFLREVVPINIDNRSSSPSSPFLFDEQLTKVDLEKVPKLKAVFKTGGTITAANASSLNDGASAVVLMSRKKATELNIPILAIIRGMADANQDPIKFTTAPSKAIPIALQRAKLSLQDIDYFELNEAFSVVALANMQILGIPEEKINVAGGAVAIGHPLGSSGSRIVVTLLNVLRDRNARFGCAAICNGGGGASALIIERV